MTVSSEGHETPRRICVHTPIFPKRPSYDDFKLQETPQGLQRITSLTVWMLPSSCSNLTTRNWFHSLPYPRFHVLLTLFPKFFSPFPHGTCLLSVSSRYLALDENYHPFSAPLPKYATLNSAPNATESGRRKYGILTLYDAFFQKDLRPVRHWQHLSRLQFSGKPTDLQVELFPVQSPLLRESYSFSIPPLTYMLKFSG